MPEYVVFRKVLLETIMLPKTFQSIELLTEGERNAERITDVSEPVLVTRLLQIPDIRRVLLEELQRPVHSLVTSGVKAPFTEVGKKPGDIDILITNPAAPQHTAALECKRVKIVSEAIGHDTLTKLDAVVEGVKQASALLDLGFFQTYLCVIAVVDAATQQERNIPNRGIDPAARANYGEEKTFTRLIAFPGREDLPHDIGIIFLEVIQPTGRSFSGLGGIGICVHHPATPRTQRPDTTNRVRAFLQGQH